MTDTVTLQKDSRQATIADVARLAGVSFATVSRVLNESAPVTTETAVRVRSAIKALGYQPRASARTLASGRVSAIGLIMPTMAFPFAVPLLQGIETAARSLGYHLLIHAAYTGEGSTPSLPRALGSHNTDGLLVFSSVLDDSEIAELHARGFPIVILFRTHCAELDIPCVTFENHRSTCKLIAHLIETHHCRRIALLTNHLNNEEFRLREDAYRDALYEHDLPYDPALVGNAGSRGVEAEAVVAGWLSDGVSFDAIFALDDDIALHAIDALQSTGRRVPEDIPVVGYDDIHFANPWAPALTTVHAPVEEAGREAVVQLVRLIEGGSATRLITLPTEVVLRHSCGCSQASTGERG